MRSTWSSIRGSAMSEIRRFARNRNIAVGAGVLALVVLAALLAGVVSTHDPRRLNPAERLKAPSARNLLGTDEFGRDVYSLVLHGAQVSLLVGVTTMLLTSLGGIVIGLTAGYYRRVDLVLMRVMDGLMAFPAIDRKSVVEGKSVRPGEGRPQTYNR